MVTHLAQVAAFADRHFVVDASSARRGSARSDLRRSSTGVDREAELARMLGGTDGATARAHARDLLGSTAVAGPSQRAASPSRRFGRARATRCGYHAAQPRTPGTPEVVRAA